MKNAIALAVAAMLAAPAVAEIVEEEVEYALPTGETAIGLAVYNDEVAAGPGVLVVPEWWGRNEYAAMRARELAEVGYVTFVADMYGNGEKTEDAGEAQKLAGAAYKEGLAALAEPALAELRGMPQVEGQVAAIGFCFGGSTVAALVKAQSGIDAGVSFHGGLNPDAAPAESGDYPPLLLLHGGADPMVPPADFAGFVEQSIEAGVPVMAVNFPDAVHAFTNPEASEKNIDGVAYDEQAAEMSMQIMRQFLAMAIGGGNADLMDENQALYEENRALRDALNREQQTKGVEEAMEDAEDLVPDELND